MGLEGDIIQAIRGVLTNISTEDAKSTAKSLITQGLECLEDISLLTEQDLPLLKPIQARKFIRKAGDFSMPKGKYFFIKSCMNGMVLDVSGASTEPGSQVITWDKKDGECDNQLWYCCPLTCTIRTKLDSSLCLDVEVEGRTTVVVNTFNADDANQKWRLDGSVIKNCENDKVLDIAANNSDAGARICMWEEHGNDNQKWEIDYVGARFFYIVSEMNGKVLTSDDEKLRVYGKDDGAEKQLWYEDKEGFLRCKHSDYYPWNKKGSGKALRCSTDQEDDAEKYHWCVCGNRVVNLENRDLVFDIKRKDDSDGAKVCCYDTHDNDNQKWRIEYA